MSKKYIAISGSLRKESINTALLKALKKINTSIDIEIVDISSFPVFNQDLEANYPENIQAIKERIIQSDGVIFVTPEYNRSIPGPLKNAIDWLSRPYGKNAFDGKSALVIGATHSALGTALAQSHLKQVLLYLNMKVMGQPEFYLTFAGEKFDSNGEITDQETRGHLKNALEAFIKFS